MKLQNRGQLKVCTSPASTMRSSWVSRVAPRNSRRCHQNPIYQVAVEGIGERAATSAAMAGETPCRLTSGGTTVENRKKFTCSHQKPLTTKSFPISEIGKTAVRSCSGGFLPLPRG